MRLMPDTWCGLDLWLNNRKIVTNGLTVKRKKFDLQNPFGQQPLQWDNCITYAPSPSPFVEGILRNMTPPPPLFKLSSPMGVSVMNIPRDRFPQRIFTESSSFEVDEFAAAFSNLALAIDPWPKTIFFAWIFCVSHWIASKASFSSLLVK